MLKDQRDNWARQFQEGLRPDMVDIYRRKRDSEEWRLSSSMEELLEYIVYLENKNG